MSLLAVTLAPLGEDFAQPATSYFGVVILALGLALAFALAMLIPYAAKRVPASWTLGRLRTRLPTRRIGTGETSETRTDVTTGLSDTTVRRGDDTGITPPLNPPRQV